jgi:hypothetical protein
MNELPIEPHKTILVLNSSYEPINFTNWKRAIVLLLKEKAQVISNRVIRLLDYVKLPMSKIMNIAPSRSMIYRRDNHTCQYCGSRSKLTIDHVVPRSKGGGDTWENLVVACSSCNTKKGNSLLENINMNLSKKPRAPINKMIFDLEKTSVEEWKQYNYGK